MATIDDVVRTGVCVGCGGCSAATGGRIPVRLGPTGLYKADLSNATSHDKLLGSKVCPFADESRNEDEIGESLFEGLPRDDRIGYYRSMFAGRVNDDTRVESSSSGGLTTWLLRALLESGKVQGVIHVGESNGPLFGYVISRTIDDLDQSRKSKYYPTSFGDVLRSIRGDGQVYAFVGIPCAIRSLRLIAESDPSLQSQIKYAVGILCGHLKSAAYAESFAWQLGVEPEHIETVDFRIKDRNLTSRQYSFGVKDRRDGEWRTAQTLSLVGGSWGHAVFQPEACNYCDDVFAETADVVIGDAWLAKYEIDWRGTNVVVSRSSELDEIFAAGDDRGDLVREPLEIDSVVRTQSGNFRHRRDGLAVRLADDDAAGRWHPTKRVQPGYPVSDERVRLIRERRNLSSVSHEAFAEAKSAGNLEVYLGAILPLIESYQSSTKMTLTRRILNKFKREAWKIVTSLRSRRQSAGQNQ
ncbi:coenzyme F420 hydrogenase subunit beta [Microbacteriaceae bacterium SG_E_30_P1]|uniref:Coenzyme F420 hydrogenase subunit beta n=1 Tax=Antiquaquibacter oligotrophicus TaxID=2880260 RepID=A0ABT6KPG3_9MICO|nr:Coenzyme F420 hydrogenase/dehydrogenase, beta subunit C-terminal domain [Antiquaquibacter oligotrophicus]MDH6181878.1 coenzyme F420 hydrogenase subunit beta [Antiquaquibacter oligotrophicus]UDF12447.1 Coenzyme F420 hydrogenase/dehydrogenase, beta subunit C-terminal domain [Antiquaquibacter oligotrophicus]